jgi:L-lactate dehydrogenase
VIASNKKIALIGTGFVGMSYAYAMLNQHACDELVLIDIDKKRAEGEAMDLNHGIAFSNTHMKIYAGSYKDCKDADIAVITAGAAQKPGESRNDLLGRNAEIFKTIIGPVVESGFSGVFLIATNPVDVMSYIAYKLSGFNRKSIVGTGTTLDTARLRYMLSRYFKIDPRNVHAYVIGEHGSSEFVPWSQALVATKPVLELCSEKRDVYSCDTIEKISEDVKNAAERIIEAKKATYYGIGMAMVRITKAILGDESSVLTVSAMLEGEYGRSGVYVGVPTVVNKNGADGVINLSLTQDELAKFQSSCDKLINLEKSLN